MNVNCSAQIKFPGENTYVLQINRVGNHGLAAILSDGSLQLLPSADIWTSGFSSSYTYAQNVDISLTGLKVYDDNVIATSGNGGIKIWDLRTRNNAPVANFKPVTDAALLCLDISNHQLASGTELVGADAGVILWDIRARSQVVSYLDSHNDDVTEIQFHPTQSNALLSGSTDGLINIFNTDIRDEDDAVYQAINHEASIHRAGFFSDKRIFGLSHMETLSVYEWADPDENVQEPKPREFGDLRQSLSCEYVADILASPRGLTSYIACGANNEKQEFKLVPFLNEKIGQPSEWVNLVGGHGEEVVRTAYIDLSTASACYTGGEDGIVRFWRPQNMEVSSIASTEEDEWESVQKKEKKHKHKHKDYKGKEGRKHKDKNDKKDKKKTKRFAPY